MEEPWMSSGEEEPWMRSAEEVEEHRCPEWASAPPILDEDGNGGNSSSCSYWDPNNSSMVCHDPQLKDWDEVPLPPSLCYFKINGTAVSHIPRDIFSDHNISVIRIEGNRRLKRIAKYAFRGVLSLRYLFISGNNIMGWPTLKEDKSFFSQFGEASELRLLVLEANNISFKGIRAPGNVSAVLPCLRQLSLARNPLHSLPADMFKPLRCSPLTHLDLRSAHLEFIHKDAFVPLQKLQYLDLFFNPKLFQPTGTCSFPIFPSFAALYNETAFDTLGLGRNLLTTVPTTTLEQVGSTLRKLNLALNYFNELGSTGSNQGASTFPHMEKLEELVLDNCVIRSVAEGTFSRLTSLLSLSLEQNPLKALSPAILTPSLQRLSIIIEEDEEMSEEEVIGFPSKLFQNSKNSLRELQLGKAKFGPLEDFHFQGLHHLQTLSLAGSQFTSFSDRLFGNLTLLQNLTLAYCSSR